MNEGRNDIERIVVAKRPSRYGVVANTTAFNDTAEAVPVRSSR